MIEEQIFSRFFHLSEPNHHHRSTLWCLFRPTGNRGKSKDWWLKFCDYQNIKVANLSSSGDDFPNSMWIRVKDFSLQRIRCKCQWILSKMIISSSLENVESSDQHCQAVCQCLEVTPGILWLLKLKPSRGGSWTDNCISCKCSLSGQNYNTFCKILVATK